jgi:hypothetical protein
MKKRVFIANPTKIVNWGVVLDSNLYGDYGTRVPQISVIEDCNRLRIFLTKVVNWVAQLVNSLFRDYGTKVPQISVIEDCNRLGIFIASNKNRGLTVIIDGEYSQEIVQRLINGGLRFGIIKLNKAIGKWIVELQNEPTLSTVGG